MELRRAEYHPPPLGVEVLIKQPPPHAGAQIRIPARRNKNKNKKNKK